MLSATVSETTPSHPLFPPPAEDRRECPRIPLAGITLWRAGHAYLGWGDVSTGGAFWSGQANVRPGAAVELSFSLPDFPGVLHLKAVVLSARPDPTGATALHLRFVDPPFDAERWIARHVDDCVRLAGWN